MLSRALLQPCRSWQQGRLLSFQPPPIFSHLEAGRFPFLFSQSVPAFLFPLAASFPFFPRLSLLSLPVPFFLLFLSLRLSSELPLLSLLCTQSYRRCSPSPLLPRNFP